MGRLDDRVVLVSGGTQGIGLAIARLALREGAAVVVTGRRTELGELSFRLVERTSTSAPHGGLAEVSGSPAP